MSFLKTTRTKSRFQRALALSAVSSLLLFAQTSNSNAQTMTIGSTAPSLNIEHWVHNGEGRFGKVENFEPGKVYIVEFWATWCGPCIASMPHIVEVQAKYADKGVQLVSVSDEKLEVVEEFLEKQIPNAKEGGPATYGELTKSYCLTVDPDKSVHTDYMNAAERHGIPCCFIVGKDAKIEWIGHPMRMDDPLAQVVDGTWDRETFGKQFRIEHAREELIYQARRQSTAAIRAKDFDKVSEIIDSSISKADTDELKFDLLMMKLPAFAIANVSSVDIEKDLMAMFDYSDSISANVKAMKLLNASKFIYDIASQNKITNKAVLERAKSLIAAGIESLPAMTKAAALDSLAHLQFVTGDVAGALESQSKAVDMAKGKQQEQYQKFLDELKSNGDKADAEKKGS